MVIDEFIDVIIRADKVNRQEVQGKLDRAIAILRAITEWTDDPFERDDYGRSYCFFCSESEYNHNHHSDNCPWIAMKQLLEEIDNG